MATCASSRAKLQSITQRFIGSRSQTERIMMNPSWNFSMGAWGTAIFSDDTACDVRDDYRDHVGDGLSGPEATNRLVDEWRATLRDPDEGPVFWLALAATQWKCGRLETRVRDKALEIIAGGSGLQRWTEDPKLFKKRKAVLAKLEEQLRSPPPAEKPIPKRFRDCCDWEVGEVIGYQLLSGKWTLFRVIDYHSDKGGICPICELLDWVGDEIPARDVLAELPVRLTAATDIGRRPNELTRFMIGRTSERELPQKRLKRLGIKLEPCQKPPPGERGKVPWPVRVYLWRSLDSELQRDFGVN